MLTLAFAAGPGEGVRPELREVEEFGRTSVALSLVMSKGRFDFNEKCVASAYFTPRFQDNEFFLQAGPVVGFVPVNERLTLYIKPRVQIENIWHILRGAGQVPVAFPALVRGYARTEETLTGLADVFAAALLDAVDVIRGNGIYRRYEQHQTDTSFPRGRFLIGDTIRRNKARGRPDRVSVSFFEHSIDIAPNQLIKTALWELYPLLDEVTPRNRRATLRADLTDALRLFETVGLDPYRRSLSDPEIMDTSRLPFTRSYYADAIGISRAIVENRSVDLNRTGQPDLELPSLLINLSDAFESYLRNTLVRLVSPYGLKALNGGYAPPMGARRNLFDTGYEEPARPDIVVVESASKKPTVVGEVKYSNHEVRRDDINQAISYAASYRSPVVLIRPKLEGDPTRHWSQFGKVGDLVIYQYRFDLAGDLDQEETTFAQFMSSFRDRSASGTDPRTLHLWS